MNNERGAVVLVVPFVLMLLFLLSGLTDKNPNAAKVPRKVDEMSVPYNGGR